MILSYLCDPDMTQLGHIDLNFIEFYIVLLDFTTKKALLWA